MEGDGPPGDVSEILRAWSDGDQVALDKLTPIVYDELRRLARRYMRREDAGHSLQSAALVNEAYIRLVDYKRMQLAESRPLLRDFLSADAPHSRRPCPPSEPEARRWLCARPAGRGCHRRRRTAERTRGARRCDERAGSISIHARSGWSKCGSLAASASKKRPRSSTCRRSP